MQPIEFRAPWSTLLKTATTFSIALLTLTFVAGVFSRSYAPWPASLLLTAAPLLIIAAAALFMVRGYVLTEDAILVKRLGWCTRLPLAGLQSVAGDVEAMRRSIRVFGNGGLLSFSGEFWSRRMGRYRALATDPDRVVVLRYPKRTIVITPHDPQHFIMRVRTMLRMDPRL